MRELIAKKYVNALMQSLSEEELSQFIASLGALNGAFEVEKFQTIIHSCEVSASQKEELLLSMLPSPSQKMTNFIRLLCVNDRINLIPYINEGLEYQSAINRNSFVGSVSGIFELTSEQIKELESSFSKKFGASISLQSNKSDYPGIKVALEDLGVEVSFSAERLKSQLTEHILKAI